MMKKTTTISSIFLAFLLTTSSVSIFAFAATSNPSAKNSSSVTGTSTSTWYYQANPVYTSVALGRTPDGLPLCSPGEGGVVCYSPSFIRTAYDYPADLNGSGQTIVIVDAYGSPTIASDLATFDSYFGLPAPPSFTIVCPPTGCPRTLTAGPHDPVSWGVETSLDVEWAHAMAPGANIVLVVAPSSSGNAINVAEAGAILAYPHSIISQSFGIPEILIRANNAQVIQAHMNYLAAAAANDTVLASTGDYGATNGYAAQNANFPASDPLVTAVGGTMGLPYNETGTIQTCAASQLCTSGLSTYLGPCVIGRLTAPNCTPVGYGGEQVWNEPDFGLATGGAASVLFSRPSYQNGFWGGATRAVADVSYNAAIDGGVLVYIGFLGGWYLVGGTSAGSPQWAAIFAIINQARANNGMPPIGFANPSLYGLGAGSPNFHDITTGNNKLGGVLSGNSAGNGWDIPTGLGTPDVANITASLS